MPRVGLAVALLLISMPAAAAEKQVRPFASVAFGGSTTFVLGDAASKKHGVLGVSAAVISDKAVGVEGEVAWLPGVFQPVAKRLLLRSSVATMTGNVVVTLPKRIADYALRPYVVAGVGLMRVRTVDSLSVLGVSKTLSAYDIGGGAIGYLSKRVGLAWDVRRFGTLKESTDTPGLTTEAGGRLSFWRASMAVVLRY